MKGTLSNFMRNSIGIKYIYDKNNKKAKKKRYFNSNVYTHFRNSQELLFLYFASKKNFKMHILDKKILILGFIKWL